MSEILIEIYTFPFKKMHLKMSSGKWRPSCLGLNVLIHWTHVADKCDVEVRRYDLHLEDTKALYTSDVESWVVVFHHDVSGLSDRLMNYRNDLHDDVIKWKHFPRYWPFVRGIHRSPVNSQHKGQWRGALMFSLIWAWINGWAIKIA